MKSKPGNRPSIRNPLSIIGLFLTLSEAVAGLAATQVTGTIQAVLVAFAVGFPVFVAIPFFVILWKRPYVFYGPSDFNKDTPVVEFVKAMTLNQTRQDKTIEEVLRLTLEPLIRDIASTTRTLNPVDPSAVLDETVRAAQAEVARRRIDIRLDEFAPDIASPSVEFAVDEHATVADLLDFTYFAIATYVDMFSYGRQWILKDAKSGSAYNAIGTTFAREKLGKPLDDRLLAEVGIKPGASLVVARP